MARAEQGCRVTGRHQIGRHTDRRARLSPERLCGRLGHGNHIWRVDEANVEGALVFVTSHLGPQTLLPPDEIDADAKISGGRHRPVNDAGRRVIAAHGVDRDTH